MSTQRPKTLESQTHKIHAGAHGTAYITVSLAPTGKPFEVFANLGKAGGCDHAYLESIGRLCSLALRNGIDTEEIVDQLRGITCCPLEKDGLLVKSAADGIATVLGEYKDAAV